MKKNASLSPFSPLANDRSWMILAVFSVVLWFGLLYIFHRWPGIDTSFSQAFFKPQSCVNETPTEAVCGFFPMSRQTLCLIMRKFFIYLPICAVVFLSIAWIRALHTGAGEKARHYGLTLLAFPIGTGLFVNCFLKTFSGRPRPCQTDLFAGIFPFEPAGSFAGQCDHNCSFISGESAAAGWLICLLFVLPSKQRTVLAPALIIASLTTSFLRLAFGGHYFSDVVLGWLSSPAIMAIIFAVETTLRSSIKMARSRR